MKDNIRNACFDTIDDFFALCLKSCGADITERIGKAITEVLPKYEPGTEKHRATLEEIDLLSNELMKYAEALQKLHKKGKKR